MAEPAKLTIVKHDENRNQPLAEVFGYRINDNSLAAKRARDAKLCPFGNVSPRCTKVRVDNPLGVCSLYEGDKNIVICPVRFRDAKAGLYQTAAEFFFPGHKNTTVMREIGIVDKAGAEAGNIDVVIAKLDAFDNIVDFGALEIQSVYISGNISLPFEHYIESPETNGEMDWRHQKKYPGPDWLSSTRKRLAPQLLYKGGILRSWKKKMAVATDKHLFATMPSLPTVSSDKAEIAWFLYDLLLSENGRYDLKLVDTRFTSFDESLRILTICEPGNERDFIEQLEKVRARRSKPK